MVISENHLLSNVTKPETLAIVDTKRYVPVLTLSAHDNAKLLQQLKSGFKRTSNWNKHQWKIAIQIPNPYLDYLTDPSLQRVNRLYVLSFGNTTDKTGHTKYYLPIVEIKDHNIMIDGQNIFNQPVKSNLRTYDNIGIIATGQRDDYTTSCLLDYNYFNKHYKMIPIDLSKQQAFDADPKAIHQINFTGNLAQDWNANKTIFFIIEEAKETIFDLSQGTVKVLKFYFVLI